MRAALAGAAMLAAAFVSRADAAPKAPTWDAAAASRYLDSRLAWWRQWPKAERDHGTRCVSCHTSLPHTLSAPALRKTPGVPEMAMVDDVVKRVYLWDAVEPFYTDQKSGVPKSSESRAVEAVLNALILSTRDAERGHLGTDTRQAFANMWALQLKNGGFAWLNFKLEPFESPDATFWGASLAAQAIARAPDGYVADPTIASKIEALRAYMKTGAGGSLYTRTLLLWADSALPGVLDPAQRGKVIADLAIAQGADGGWSLPSLGPWQRIDGSTLPVTSDGYATAVAALALREAGVPLTDPVQKKARLWLAAHQDKASGVVPAQSINKDRQPGTDAFLFMTDEATGMAALAMRR